MLSPPDSRDALSSSGLYTPTVKRLLPQSHRLRLYGQSFPQSGHLRLKPPNVSAPSFSLPAEGTPPATGFSATPDVSVFCGTISPHSLTGTRSKSSLHAEHTILLILFTVPHAGHFFPFTTQPPLSEPFLTLPSKSVLFIDTLNSVLS